MIGGDHVPADPDVEETLIGALLVGMGTYVPHCASIVRPEMFTVALWSAAFTAMLERWKADKPIDSFLIAQDLFGHDKLRAWESIGRIQHELDRVSLNAPTASYAPFYAESVAGLAKRRQWIGYAGELARLAYDGDAEKAIAWVRGKVDEHDTEHVAQTRETLAEIAARIRREVDEGVELGWRTGIEDYDEWSGGLRRGRVHVVGGQSGVGKTMLISQVAAAASSEGARVLVCSLEMPSDDVFIRLLASYMGSSALALVNRRAPADRAKWDLAEAALLRDDRIAIDAYSVTVEEIRAETRRFNADLVIVDYVGLMAPPRNARREDEGIAANMRAIQRMSKRENCAVLMVSQLSNQAVNEANAGRPSVTGFMGSGAIAQVASFATFLTRHPEIPGLVTLWNIKNRYGPTGGRKDYALATKTGLWVKRDELNSGLG